MAKAMYLNWGMEIVDFEEFELVLEEQGFYDVEIISYEEYEAGEDYLACQVTVWVDSDKSCEYAQFLEEYGFDYSGTVGA